jgi:hypothetical protein
MKKWKNGKNFHFNYKHINSLFWNWEIGPLLETYIRQIQCISAPPNRSILIMSNKQKQLSSLTEDGIMSIIDP